MVEFLIELLLVARSRLKSRARLEAENLVLRQQLIVLSRRSPRVWLRNIDRLIFVWAYRLFPWMLNAIVVVKPETVLRWLLMGKLFDENGEPLYSCWAKKGQRRYRYLVSKKLARGTAKPDDRGWRLPAEQIEQAVMGGIRQMLSGRAALASTLKAGGFAAAELKPAVESVDAQVKSHFENKEEGGTLIERVELKRDGMQITLNLRALLSVDRFPTGATNLRMTRLVPLEIKQRGVETRLVLPGEVQPSRSDPALLRALARGYQWFGELAARTVLSTSQIAAREGVSDSYVRHMVPLALLAPAIVESICTGRQGVCLSAERLLRTDCYAGACRSFSNSK